jgi:fibronectin type 3 domain-containing protein
VSNRTKLSNKLKRLIEEEHMDRFSKRMTSNDRQRNSIRQSIKKTRLGILMLALFGIGLALAGSGCGGGSGAVSSEVVIGVAAVGDVLAGEATIKDSLGNERKTVIGSDGSFALDVTNMTGPFILKAAGSSKGADYTLHSFAAGPGRANINPFANALVANAAEVDDPAKVYEKPDWATLDKVKTRLPQSVAELLMKLKPLLKNYAADSDDPISGEYRADRTRLDGVFDDVKISLSNGTLIITNAQTGVIIFSGLVTDILNGYFNSDENALPKPGSVPLAPTGLSATTGASQITLSWAAVGNATSYNVYWSTATGVTTASGTKLAGATSPYVHTGLTAGASFYYIVTAVNGAGESTASVEVSATTNSVPAPTPAVPAAPAGLIATGGTKQTTISWSAVAGAASYNIYWSTTSGVTKANGTKIAGATSPAVHTGLLDSTVYYYVVTAVNSVGESAASVQIAATTITPTPNPTAPAAPNGLSATGGSQQMTISWSAVAGATSYNLYYATASGVTVATGTRIAGVTSPYVQTGLSAGATYYYIVTAVNSVGQSAPSIQTSAATNAPLPTVPATPGGVTATGGAKQVTISWTAVSGATSYNIYWSTAAGMTTVTGTKIAGATSPYVQTGLADGTTYYYVVTAANSAGESAGSSQASAVTNAPVPVVPAVPAGVTATGGAKQVSISWVAVSGATSYNIYWSTVPGVTTVNGTKIAGAANPYVQTGLADGITYYYIITAANSAGESAGSSQASAVTNAPVPVVPAVPAGVTAAGGSKQVTISWSAVSGATSYNIYWSIATGVTTVTGTKIAGATSPYVQGGLADGTAYYYIVTAANSAGESAGSSQATATTTAVAPPPPALDGAALYSANCQRCHGALASTDIVARTLQGVKDASMTRGLTDAQVQAIVSALP